MRTTPPPFLQKTRSYVHTGSDVHVLVPAPPHQLSQRPGPVVLQGRSPSALDDALYELLPVEPLERPAEAKHFPQDQPEAVNVGLVSCVGRCRVMEGGREEEGA